MITELINSVNTDIDALSMTIEKASIVMDYEYNQYLIECATNELNSITEAVGLDHPEGQATEGLIGKASRIIKKVVAALIEAIKNMYTKIRTAIEDAKFNAAVKKAEKVAKENSKLKNKVIKVHNPEGELKVVRQYRDFLNKMEAKAKAGKTDGIMAEIERESSDYSKKLDAARIAATVTVTVSAAIAMLKTHADKVSDKAATALVNASKVGEEFKGRSAEFVNAVVKIQNELAKAAKDEASAISKAITSAMSAIRDGVISSTEVKANDTSAKDTVKDAMESEEVSSDEADIDSIVESVINEAETIISESNTKELVDAFEDTVSKNDEFDPLAFLEKYEASLESTDSISEDDIEFKSSSVADFIVNTALNK